MTLSKIVWMIIGFALGFWVGHSAFAVIDLSYDFNQLAVSYDLSIEQPRPNRRTATLEPPTFKVLPKRLISIFGLESSGTTFLADALTEALGGRVRPKLELHSLNKRKLVPRTVRDDLHYSCGESEVQHLSLPWGYHDRFSTPLNRHHLMPPTVEFIAPAACMVYPLFVRPETQKLFNEEPPHPSCVAEVGLSKRILYPRRFFVDIVSHIRWYQQRGTNATAIIMIRDEGIHLQGKNRHTKNLTRSIAEDNVGKAIIAKAIEELDSAAGEVLLVSYETLMSMKEVYLFDIYKKLGIQSNFTPVFKNGNEKYIQNIPVSTTRVILTKSELSRAVSIP